MRGFEVPGSRAERRGFMDSFDQAQAEAIEHAEAFDRLEVTDIASDEEMDGDVDADGGAAISRRDE